MAETPLEWLESEFGGVRVVLALCHFDELRPDETSQINCLCHFFRILTSHPAPNARWARTGVRVPVGLRRLAPAPSYVNVSAVYQRAHGILVTAARRSS